MPPLIGTDPSFAAERRFRMDANDDAQIRMRRVLKVLNAVHGLVIHDLVVVIDGAADPDVKSAAEDVRADLENMLGDAQCGLRWAVDASGGNEVHERPMAAAAE